MRMLLATLVALLMVPVPTPAADEPAGPMGSQETLRRIVSADLSFAPDVPTPEAVLGFRVGERHVSHDQLVMYMRAVAEASSRVALLPGDAGEARSHELRPLLLLTISTPERVAQAEAVRRAHLQGIEDGDDDLPVVVYLGYSVHGNEASGSNASLLVAYLLAAGQGAAVDAILDHSVVLLDPSLNPDGLQRFSTWVNAHRGAVPVADRNTREHREVWPNGRTNHYWFDLNRDWLPLVHPESRNRIRNFHRWKPHVLADFHEMGTDNTYFFQPGVPSRKNPLTPDENVRLTEAIAEHHAEILDTNEVLYYSEESFDDFYYGKGSTYPDINGSVGILFEQASARGHLAEASDGYRFTFVEAVRQQLMTSISTLRGAVDQRSALRDYQHRFYAGAEAAAAEAGIGGWLFDAPGDPVRAAALAELLGRHDIQLHRVTATSEVDGRRFSPGAWFVPADQAQFQLARAMFETRDSYQDPVFYDVSTWNLAMAYDLDLAELSRSRASRLQLGEVPARSPTPVDGDAYAWIIPWEQSEAPAALWSLLDAGVRVRASSLPLSLVDGRELPPGALLIAAGRQALERSALVELLRGLEVDIVSLASGLTARGADLGSPSISPIQTPRPLLVVGDGVSAYDSGEVWHLLDHEVGMPVVQVERDDLPRVALDDYTHLILVSGRYSWSDAEVAEIAAWVERGGVLIGQERAVDWLAGNELIPVGLVEDEETEVPDERRDYAFRDRDAALDLVSGTIFEADVDTTHPLGWGLSDRRLPVFRGSTRVLETPESAFERVAVYSEVGRLSGYATDENIERIVGTPAVLATRRGSGTVIALMDDVGFRGFWVGSRRLMLNAIFMSGQIERTP